MGLRKLVRNTFGFSRAQSNGFVILLPIISIALFSEPVYRWWVSQRNEDFSKESAELDSLYSTWQNHKEEQNQVALEEDAAISYFKFDPNLVSQEELLALGFSKGLTKRLLNYREKGGRFKVKSDVKKLYGMDSTFYEALAPYILLPVEILKPDKPLFSKKKFEPFDLNLADTTQLKSIYGIGSTLALRIIKYRDKLGGFIHKNQLQEVYGLDTAVVNKLNKASFLNEKVNLKKININTADEATLGAHPYIKKKIAASIVAYRFQHGAFQTLEEIKKVKLVDDSWFQKVLPYLTLND